MSKKDQIDLALRILLAHNKIKNQLTQATRSKESSTPKPFAYRTLQKYLNPIMTVANEATTASELMSSSLLFSPLMGGYMGTAGGGVPVLFPAGAASAIVWISLLFSSTRKHKHTQKHQTGWRVTNVESRRVCVRGVRAS